MKRLLVTLAALAALTLPAQAQETRDYTDDLGRTVETPADPQRIVSMHDISITLQLVELGVMPVGSHGRTDASGEPYIRTVRDLFDVDFSNSDITFIGNFTSYDLETVAALEPDLIIGRPNNEDILDQLSVIAPTVLVATTENPDMFLGYRELADIAGALDSFEAMKPDYDEMISGVKALYNNWDEVTIAPMMTYGTFTGFRRFGAFAQAMSDLGIGLPESFEGMAGDDRFEVSAEALQTLDADFMMLSYGTGQPDRATPALLRERMADLLPNWCEFLHACRNSQVLYLSRPPIYARSFLSLEKANDFITTHVAGRDFVPLDD